MIALHATPSSLTHRAWQSSTDGSTTLPRSVPGDAPCTIRPQHQDNGEDGGKGDGGLGDGGDGGGGDGGGGVGGGFGGGDGGGAISWQTKWERYVSTQSFAYHLPLSTIRQSPAAEGCPPAQGEEMARFAPTHTSSSASCGHATAHFHAALLPSRRPPIQALVSSSIFASSSLWKSVVMAASVPP